MEKPWTDDEFFKQLGEETYDINDKTEEVDTGDYRERLDQSYKL